MNDYLDSEGYINAKCPLLRLVADTALVPKFRGIDRVLERIPDGEQALVFTSFIAVASIVQWVSDSCASPLS